MEIRVKLYGALGKDLREHDPLKGMTVELPEGMRILDLIEQLGIPRKKVGIISVDGRLVKDTRVLGAGNFVRMYRPIFGG
ncbi:MAG: hypothetical protein LJE94_00085 [Deltaproteobacteria bacterium]|nr:hypothetical protein [Deltaproteobacteria bacterium]